MISQCTASNFSGAKAGDRRRATAADRYKGRSRGKGAGAGALAGALV